MTRPCHSISKLLRGKGNKLSSKWLGPYTTVEIHKNGTFIVVDANGKVRASKIFASQVKRYTERDEDDADIYCYVYQLL